MPAVSIVIPVYNADKGEKEGIRRCIQSILDQQYQDYEIIAVDDGSSDDSGKILDDFAGKDKRVHVIHQKNGGVSRARNNALKHAQGKYIQFMDADDFIPKDSTKLLVRTAEEKKVDLVVADFYRVTGNSVARKGNIGTDEVMSLQEYAEYMKDSPADFYYGVLWNKLYKKSIIQNNSVEMDESLDWCEDLIFNLEYLVHTKKIAALQVPVYYYVKTKGSLVNQSFSISKVVEMKANVFQYYSQFYKEVLDEKQYRKERLGIAGFLVSAASDDRNIPLLPSTKKLGKETVHAEYDPADEAAASTLAYYVMKVYDRLLSSVAMKYNLSLNDVKVMAALKDGENVTSSKEIADFTGMSSVSVSATTTRLQMKGLVKMEINDDNEKVRIVLSDKASDIAKDLETANHDMNDILFNGFSQAERKKIRNAIVKITDNLRKAL